MHQEIKNYFVSPDRAGQVSPRREIMRRYVALGVMCMLLFAATGCDSSKEDEIPTTMECDNSKENESCNPLSLADDYYLGRGGQRIPIQRVDNKFYILFYSDDKCRIKSELANVDAEIYILQEWACHSFLTDKPTLSAEREKARAIVKGDYEQIAPTLAITHYWAPFFRTENGEKMGLIELFAVMLKPETTMLHLEKLAKENSVRIIGRDRYVSNRYHLVCSNLSKGNALQMANLFFETGLFEDAFPDFLGVVRLD